MSSKQSVQLNGSNGIKYPEPQKSGYFSHGVESTRYQQDDNKAEQGLLFQGIFPSSEEEPRVSLVLPRGLQNREGESLESRQWPQRAYTLPAEGRDAGRDKHVDLRPEAVPEKTDSRQQSAAHINPPPLYSQLSIETNQIRLLSLQPSQNTSAEIHCRLLVVSLDTKPVYKALSYCWAQTKGTGHIFLDGYHVEVTTNLESALKHLRDNANEVMLWVDALCINQNDVEERNLQILRMLSIYGSALEVVAWLGNEKAGKPNLFVELQQLAEMAMCDLEMTAVQRFYVDLLSRQYWRRIWMIQEIAVASAVRLVCGPISLEWDHFCFLLDNLQRRRDFLNTNRVGIATKASPAEHDHAEAAQRQFSLGQQPQAPEDNHLELSDMSRRIGDNLERSTNESPEGQSDAASPSVDFDPIKSSDGIQSFRDFRSMMLKGKSILLLRALELSKNFLATNPLDKIYALLGFVEDGAKLVPFPDYKITMEELQWRMTKVYMGRTRSLDLLLICNKSLSPEPAARTWSPNWQLTEPGIIRDYVFQAPELKYSTDGKRYYFPDVGEPLSSATLTVRGSFYDSIEGLTGRYDSKDAHMSTCLDLGLIQPQTVEQNPYSPSRLSHAIWACLNEGFSLNRPGEVLESHERYHVGLAMSIFYGVVPCTDTWISRVKAFYSPKRTFDTPTLSRWIEETGVWTIHNQTTRSWCSPRTVFYGPNLWLAQGWVLFPISITVVAIWLIVINLRTHLLVILAFLGFPFLAKGVFEFEILRWDQICESRRLQHMFLKTLDSRMGRNPMRLFITRKHGFIGLGHRDAQKDDHVFILEGCSTPIILRPFEDGYKVVGIAYIEDIMAGQAIKELSGNWRRYRLY